MTIEVGPWTAGERPGRLEYQFLDANGAGIDLTGYTVTFVYERYGGTAVTRTGVLATAASGIVGYTFVAADLDTGGVYTGEFKANNGTNYYVSERLVYRVYDAVA